MGASGHRTWLAQVRPASRPPSPPATMPQRRRRRSTRATGRGYAPPTANDHRRSNERRYDGRAMSYEVRTAVYEGPPDLLLQLITSHRLPGTEARLSPL